MLMLGRGVNASGAGDGGLSSKSSSEIFRKECASSSFSSSGCLLRCDLSRINSLNSFCAADMIGKVEFVGVFGRVRAKDGAYAISSCSSCKRGDFLGVAE